MDADTKRLASLIESALADVAAAVGQGAKSLGMVENAMAEALGVLEQRGVIDHGALLKAIAEARPVVHINVPPQPAPVVQVMPAAEFEVSRPGGYGQPDVVLMRIKRVA